MFTCVHGRRLNVNIVRGRGVSQGLEVHPLSERLPHVAPGGRNQAGAVLTSHFPVLEVHLGGLRVTQWLHVQDAQRSVLSAGGSGPTGVVPLELLDDGRKLGIQRRSAGFGARRRARSAVLLLLVRRRRGSTSGRRWRPGGASGRSIRLSTHWRGRGLAFLAAAGCRDGDWA